MPTSRCRLGVSGCSLSNWCADSGSAGANCQTGSKGGVIFNPNCACSVLLRPSSKPLLLSGGTVLLRLDPSCMGEHAHCLSVVYLHAELSSVGVDRGQMCRELGVVCHKSDDVVEGNNWDHRAVEVFLNGLNRRKIALLLPFLPFKRTLQHTRQMWIKYLRACLAQSEHQQAARPWHQ